MVLSGKIPSSSPWSAQGPAHFHSSFYLEANAPKGAATSYAAAGDDGTGDFVSGPCDTAALLEFGSLGFCSREDGTGTYLFPHLLTYLRQETQCGKEGSVMFVVFFIQKRYRVSHNLLGKRSSHMTSTKGQCHM